MKISDIIKHVPTESLIPYDRNPRIHNKEQIDQIISSIKEFGFTNPILVDGNNGIVAGHGRLEAAKRMCLKTVPIIELSYLTEAQKKAYLIADNKIAENAKWDDELLRLEFSDLKNFDYNLTLTGFNENELDELFDFEKESKNVDVDPRFNEAEELRKKFNVEAGQIWQIGRHKIMCGDSTDDKTFSSLLSTSKAKMSVTSCPYGVGKSYEIKGIDPWFKTIRPVIQNLCRTCEIIIWQIVDLYSTGTQFIEPTLAYSINMFFEHSFYPLWLRVWEKPGINFGVSPYHLVTNKPAQQYEQILAVGNKERDHDNDSGTGTGSGNDYDGDYSDYTDYEWISAFAKHGHKFVKRLSKRERKEYGYSGVWKIAPVKHNDRHPAMFPVELPSRCIKMHSDENDLVIDPFLGSGTSIVACENLNRIGFGIELFPEFCAVAIQRIADLTGEKPKIVQGI